MKCSVITAGVVAMALAGSSKAATLLQFDTTLGTFNVQLFDTTPTATTTNFLNYVTSDAYSYTLFHRTADLSGSGNPSILQGGGFGFFSDGNNGIVLAPMDAGNPIPLQYDRPNRRGTLAMARTSALNSATTQWFINTADNSQILGAANNGGYAVFGQVLNDGMRVVDALAAMPRFDQTGFFTDYYYTQFFYSVYRSKFNSDQETLNYLMSLGAAFGELPLQGYTTADYLNNTPISLNNFLLVNRVTVLHPLTGDANLDGKITADDYLAMDSSFLLGGGDAWDRGDFNGDGKVDATDYTLIDAGYLQAGGVEAEAMVALHAQWFGAEYPAAVWAEVPEPGTLGIVALGATALLTRARRQRNRITRTAAAS